MKGEHPRLVPQEVSVAVVKSNCIRAVKLPGHLDSPVADKLENQLGIIPGFDAVFAGELIPVVYLTAGGQPEVAVDKWLGHISHSCMETVPNCTARNLDDS